MDDNIVWINDVIRAHTATSGADSSDPNSGKTIDIEIIMPERNQLPFSSNVQMKKRKWRVTVWFIRL
ncbi:MAG: hypothetical protein ACRD8W_02050 [Nitrososphaeraceae archaeon]